MIYAIITSLLFSLWVGASCAFLIKDLRDKASVGTCAFDCALIALSLMTWCKFIVVSAMVDAYTAVICAAGK